MPATYPNWLPNFEYCKCEMCTLPTFYKIVYFGFIDLVVGSSCNFWSIIEHYFTIIYFLTLQLGLATKSTRLACH